MSSNLIGVVDYGAGNLRSVTHSLYELNLNVELCSDPNQLSKYSRIILPGVGAFHAGMSALNEKGFVNALHKVALEDKKPILGICLGMQFMAKTGNENGKISGLGWFDAEVIGFQDSKEFPQQSFKVPHVGWNNIEFSQAHPLRDGISDGTDFYFLHSYFFSLNKKEESLATCDYGIKFACAIASKNIVGVQFHPEKSQRAGLTLLKNFSNWTPQ